MTDRPPLLVFSDDWGRHPSSCQHLVARLLGRRQVVWANTIGTRPPALNLATVRRGFEKLRQWTRSATPAAESPGDGPPAPIVLNPKMWPSFRTRMSRTLNRRLLLRGLRPTLATLPQPPVVVTTIPVVADLVGTFPAARWVYYCVDDFSVWPGLDGPTLLRMDERLVRRADACVVVSDVLGRHVERLGKPAHLLTHGVDLAHWRTPAPVELPASLRGLDPLPGPLVVFWGVIDRRMDTAFVRELSQRMTTGTIVLVGPQDHPDPELLKLPRVATLPAVPYADLPALAARAAVLVMPYADLPVTRAMQPLKLKEYLATGRPVVVRDLPSTRAWTDCLDAADTPERFAAAVLERLRDGLPESQRAARSRLDAEGWDAKAAQFEQHIDGHV